MYTVSGITPDDAHSLRLCDLLNLVSYVSVCHTRLADADGLLHCLLRRGDEVGRLLVDLADGVCGIQIAVEAIVDWPSAANVHQTQVSSHNETSRLTISPSTGHQLRLIYTTIEADPMAVGLEYPANQLVTY